MINNETEIDNRKNIDENIFEKENYQRLKELLKNDNVQEFIQILHYLTFKNNYKNNNLPMTKAKKIENDKTYIFDYVKELEIITTESSKGETVLLVNSKENAYSTCYYDIFSEVRFDSGDIKIIKRELFKKYLFAYNFLKKNYTKQELKDFFEKVKKEKFNIENKDIKTKK